MKHHQAIEFDDKDKSVLLKAIKEIIDDCKQPISILVNNMAMDKHHYESQISSMTSLTTNSISNHAMLTKYCCDDMRKEDGTELTTRTAVICMGTWPEDIGKEAKKFKVEEEEQKFVAIRSIIQYKTMMVKNLVNTSTPMADFVIDEPARLGFLKANLKYLGIEHTPLTHVD